MPENQNINLYGGPTKRFFVEMITKDIELDDAILDLLDNCIDGAIRLVGDNPSTNNDFDGYHADLDISKDKFSLTDNCGGITDEYVSDAFTLGRPSISKDGNIPTIGMFGIGMKRAIFKMGRASSVSSNSIDGLVTVNYTKEWMDPENQNWELPIARHDQNIDNDNGVTIAINNLRPEVSNAFSNASFLDSLHKKISEYFAYLIQKGFKISLNGEVIEPAFLKLVFIEPTKNKSQSIKPYYFESEIDSVKITVIVGLYRKLARESELDAETLQPQASDQAGITVVCNDRVIILRDRTMRTGWGDGAPQYHSQFRAIAGLILFSSSNAEKLPISTTKRGINIESDIYYSARREAIAGIKAFTGFTNKWKGMESEVDKYFGKDSLADAKSKSSEARTLGVQLRKEKGVRYTPELPVPTDVNPRRRISFVRTEVEIKTVSKYLFEDGGQHPSEVGNECFQLILGEAKE